MLLCHLKNSELAKEYQKYKGRAVFRGDTVKDENDFYAVFSEQGTSASNMSAAKFLAFIARLPGNDGEDSDAGVGVAVWGGSLGEPLAAFLKVPREVRLLWGAQRDLSPASLVWIS